jgi:hypothetical protein
VSRTGKRRTKHNGKDLRPPLLRERKAKLAQLLAGSAVASCSMINTDQDGAVRYPGRARQHPKVRDKQFRRPRANLWPYFTVSAVGAGGDLCALRVAHGIRHHNCISLTEDEQHKIAGAIVDHLESHNWKMEHGPALEWHGRNLTGVPPG